MIQAYKIAIKDTPTPWSLYSENYKTNLNLVFFNKFLTICIVVIFMLSYIIIRVVDESKLWIVIKT